MFLLFGGFEAWASRFEGLLEWVSTKPWLPEEIKHYHAPWSRKFKTYYLRGSHSHEIQVGPLVFQLKRRNAARNTLFKVWRDTYWRR